MGRWDADRANFATAAKGFWEGRISAEAFLRATDARWQWIGRNLFARWRRKLPDWVEDQDVVQELRVLALEFAKKWDPAKGAIGPFVVWSATHRAQRAMHVWRGALLSGNEGKNPSRAERSLTRAFGDKADRVSGRLVAPATDMEERLDRERRFADVLGTAVSMREAIVLRVLRVSEGSIEDAAEAIVGTQEFRIECAIATVDQARELVREVVKRIARELKLELVEVDGQRNPGSGLSIPEDFFYGDDEDEAEAIELTRAIVTAAA